MMKNSFFLQEVLLVGTKSIDLLLLLPLLLQVRACSTWIINSVLQASLLEPLRTLVPIPSLSLVPRLLISAPQVLNHFLQTTPLPLLSLHHLLLPGKNGVFLRGTQTLRREIYLLHLRRHLRGGFGRLRFLLGKRVRVRRV